MGKVPLDATGLAAWGTPTWKAVPLACTVLLAGCFISMPRYAEDGTADSGSEPNIHDWQDLVDAVPAEAGPDSGLDFSTDPDLDAPPSTPWFVTIPTGTFTMGSPPSEPGRSPREIEHPVTLTRAFEIMAREVTQDQFHALMGYRPSAFSSCGGSCPAETVCWHEAAAFANTLSMSGGLATCYTCTGSGTGVSCDTSASYATPYDCPGYRLPTEAEWEYAARAGTTGGTYNGTSTPTDCTMPNAVLDPIAWFCGNSSSTTHAVGGKLANAWGLYDMLGNVWEWCNDWFAEYGWTVDPWGPSAGSFRIIRGGSWSSDAKLIRAAFRDDHDPGARSIAIGFRLARSLP